MNQKGNTLIVLIILAALAIGAVIYYKSQPTITLPSGSPQPESTKSAVQTKTFQSKNLKFIIELPNQFTAIDEASRIMISSNSGQIYVNRNGTQFDDLKSYLNDFDNGTNLKTSQDESLVINGNQARIRIFTNSKVGMGKEKIYFIYSNNFVYKISTISESLFNDLDQIAQTFRYTP